MFRSRGDGHQMHDLPRATAKNPFNDNYRASLDHSIQSSRVSSPTSEYGASSTLRGKSQFISYRLTGEYQQPWSSDPRMKLTRRNNWIVYSFIVVGVCLSAFICFNDARSIAKNEYCLIHEDHFSKLDPAIWSHEIQIDGFGTGSFDWTTDDPKNAYADADGLHIVPTLTNETTNINNDMLYNGGTLNLTVDGTCTSTRTSSCSIKSNSTLGTMIPPVRSARLTTKGKKSIRYGRVEVVAKLPQGDWLWPAICM
jgi:hypothetical protein